MPLYRVVRRVLEEALITADTPEEAREIGDSAVMDVLDEYYPYDSEVVSVEETEETD